MIEDNRFKEVRIAASRRRLPLLVLAVAGLALWSWPGGMWDIWSRADAEWIQWLRTMVAGRHWSPRGNWPLANWLCQFILVITDNNVSTWALRMPSVVFGVVSLMLTYRIGCVLFGAGVGWLAGLIFFATAGLAGVVPALNPGMMLTAWIMLALDAWLQRPEGRVGIGRIVSILLFTTLGLLTAGWPAPAVVIAVIAADLYSRRKIALVGAWIAAGVITSIDTRHWAASLATLVPAMAILLALLTSYLSAKKIPSTIGRTIGVAGVIASISILAFGLIMFGEPDWFWVRGFFIMQSGLIMLLVFIILLFLISVLLIALPRSSIVIGGILMLLTAATVVVLGGLKPAMNPVRTAANVSELLEHYLPDDDAVVGALGKAGDARYHVHGDYRVEKVTRNPKKFARAKHVPAVLIGRRKDIDQMASALREKAYTPAKTIDAFGRELVVMHRNGSKQKQRESSKVRLLALGDTGTGDPQQYNVGRRMAEQHDRFGRVTACLLLGDVLYGGDKLKTALEKRFLKPFDPLIERKVPFYAALGNHDYAPFKKAKFLMKSPWFNMNRHNYYSQTFGNGLVTVFVLDCETVKHDPAQFLWLENELRNCRSTWKILINHIPMVASNVLHSDNPDTFDLLDHVMLDGGIDLVLSGHNHLYERRRLLEGIQYLTIGSGGHVSDHFEFPPDPNRAVGYNRASCFSWMEVTHDAIRFQVRNEYGMLIDEFRLTHGEDGRGRVADLMPPQRLRLPTLVQANVAVGREIGTTIARALTSR